MTSRSLVFAIAFACLAACGSGKKKANGVVDANVVCGLYGTPCATGGDCCSNTCDPQGGCTVNPTNCSDAGTTCSSNTDCCSFSCVSGVCQSSCTPDNGSCSSNGQCCGGLCNNGACTPLNPNCKSAGNPCSANGDCCGGFCNSSGTCGNASWCVVNGNSCSHDAECCGGICTIPSGGTIGVCDQPSPGATNCTAGIDGQPCGTCGDCCSALCEIYAPTGVKVCQPAEGCRVDGDTCHATSDCCGAPGTNLPGAGEVQCIGDSGGTVPNAQDTIGICRNPTGCDPEGDTCHYLNYTCGNSSKRNDCCACISGKQCCVLDALGAPRCNAITTCVMPGGQCAFAGDCCNGEPCVPNGQGQLVCGASCVNTSGMCTNTGDCCNGLTCVFTPGQTYGTCGGGSGSGSGSGYNCPLSGQACSDTNPCCANLGLTCEVSSSPGTPCPAGMETGCVCNGNIIP
jgi:hypothetical protein